MSNEPFAMPASNQQKRNALTVNRERHRYEDPAGPRGSSASDASQADLREIRLFAAPA